MIRKTFKYIIPVILFIGFGLSIPHFMETDNLLNIIKQCSVIAMCAVGMTMVIVIKGIDLSIGGTMALSAMVTCMLLLTGVGLVFSFIAGIMVGILIGLINGLLIAKLEVPAFIASLVMGQIATGITLLLNNGRSLGGFPEEYVNFGNGQLIGIPIPNYFMVVFLIIGMFIMKRTALGNHIYALGGNELVVRQEGINVNRIKIFTFAFSGFCAATGGILLSAQMDTVHPIQGESFVLDSIAACILGGVSLMGGEGKVWQSVIGALIIGVIRNGLNLLTIHPFTQNVAVGSVIIIVVAISVYNKRMKVEASKIY